MARSLRPLDIFPITTRHLQVLRTSEVTPGMRRVTLGGEQLKAHTAANGFPVEEFRSAGFDDEFKLLIRHPDVAVAVGPTQADGILDWPRGDEHMLIRTYTIRRWDPEAGELDVDFVNHGVGPATSWARNAQPGDHIQVAGPKSSATHPEEADWVLIGADETALPAVGRWLEEWPEGARGQVFIEVEEQSHRQDLVVPEGVELTWLVREDAGAGTTTLLFDAFRAAPWWEGRVFAWVAGEAGTLTPIRRWLRREKGLPKEQVEVTGYWKRQEVTASAENPELPDFAASEDAREVFHELAEIMPGFALRVAATLGLGPALGTAERTLAELVAETGADSAGLAKLLRYLRVLKVVEETPGGWRLTTLGSELDNDRIAEHLNLGGAHAHRELAGALALLESVRGGIHPGYSESAAHLQERVEDEAGFSSYLAAALAAALAADPAFADLGTLRIAGRGAATFAHAVVDKHPKVQVSVVGTEAELAALQAVEAAHERISYTTDLAKADAVLLIESLSARPDFEAVAVLREAARHGRLYYFADVLNPELAHEHDFEDDLVAFALNGGGERTAGELDRLFADAELGAPRRRTIGWGFTLHEFGI